MALVMLLGMFPVQAFAQEEPGGGMLPSEKALQLGIFSTQEFNEALEDVEADEEDPEATPKAH